MNKLERFYKLSERIFFVSIFSLFFLGLLMKNEIWTNKIKTIIFTVDLPVIFFVIAYGLLSLRFSITNEGNDVLDSLLLFIGGSTFLFFLFIQFTYPNII